VGIRLSIPVIMLFIVLLLLPQARMRGQADVRMRESVPRPEMGNALKGAAVFVVVVAVLAALLAGELGWAGDSNWLSYMSRGLALAVIALSLVPLVGYGGQISLAVMTFAGIGALTASHWHIGGPIETLLALVAAIVVTAVVGAFIALPALRLRGIYLALATMAFAVFMDRTVFTQRSVFGNGSRPVPRFELFGLELTSDMSYTIFLGVMVALVGLFIVVLRRGPLGRRLQAMKDSEAACATLGINLTRTKVEVFALSAGIAGLGGALLGGQKGTVIPSDFEMFQSLPVLLVSVAGGIALVSGAIAGAIFLALFPFWIDIAPDWNILGTSAVDVVRNITLVAPGLIGITLARNPNGSVADVRDRLRRRRERREQARDGTQGRVAGPGEQLETLGIDRPFEFDDIEVIDEVLDLDGVRAEREAHLARN
jgi:ABC-type branched-subunit amino acid transport system permease subunit